MSIVPDALLDELNPAQHAAVTHVSGPLLIVAGAGTGKTSVITRRMAWLIREGLANPEEILALTFTDKAAQEMEERVDRLLPYGYVDLWISTFHGFGERVLRERGLEIGLPHSFRVLDETAQWLLLRRHFERLQLSYYRPLGNPTRFLQALLTHFSRAEDELVTPAMYSEYVKHLQLNTDQTVATADTTDAARLVEVADAYHLYKQLLREEEALDFSDLINETLRLYRERPNILSEYRQRFKYILVDEFQDTNYAQYELVRLLSAPKNNITVVGDDDQSIYKFRGASVSNILDFERDYPDLTRVVLTDNYRSKQEVLDAAYAFIQHNNPDRLEARLAGQLSKRLVATRGTGGEIHRLHGTTVGDEARLVVEAILDRKSESPQTSWNDFAILVRANDHAEPFLQQLRLRGIPHEFMAARGLYTQSLVVDILSYLRVLVDPHHSVGLYRVLTSAAVGLGQSDAIAINHEARRRSESVWSVCRRIESVPDITPEAVTRIRTTLGRLEQHALRARQDVVGQIVLLFLHDTGYLKFLTSQSDAISRDAMRILQQLWKQVERFANEETSPIVERFLEMVDMSLAAGDSGFLPPDPDAGPELVRVMTVHAAKGLEFAHVFMVNLVDRRFPTTERRDAIPLPDVFVKEYLPEGDPHLQEERRLLYVAMTRAKDTLWLTSAEDYGGARAKKLSRFLGELNLPEQPAESREPMIELLPQPRPIFAGFVIPEKMSFTQFAAFRACPLQYKLEHLLRIPKRGNENQSFGQSVHGTLQEWFERYRARSQVTTPTLFSEPASDTPLPFGQHIPLDEALDIYREKFVDEWYTSATRKKERYEHGRKALAAYYQELKEQIIDIHGLEVGFTIKIGRATVKGRIDRIDRKPDGTVEIIDYKTGRPKDKPDRDQLFIYQLATQRVLGLKPSMLTFLYLEGLVRHSFIGTEDELSAFEADLEKTVERIHASDFSATPSPQICSFCDFASICEYRA